MHFEIMRGGRGCGGCGGVLSRERGVFGSAANLRGTVERTPGRQPRGVGGGGGGTGCPRPGPLLSPSPCRWLRGSEGSAGSQRVTGVFRGRGKHACAAASPAAVGLRRGNTRSGSRTQVKRRQQFRGRMTQESSALLICYRALREVH